MKPYVPLLALSLLLPTLGCDSRGTPADREDPQARSIQRELDPFWKIRFSLKPMLEREEALRPEWVSRTFMAGLAVTYVIDRIGKIERITHAHLEHWRIDLDRLHRESIAAMTAPFLTEAGRLEWRIFSGKDQKPFLAAPALESTFAASVILSPAFQVGVENIFGTWEGLWVAIPSRSSCRVHAPPTPENLEKLRKEFLRDHETAAHPLMRGYLLTAPDGGFRTGLIF